MFTKKSNNPRKVWFKEKRGDLPSRWYIGTVIGTKALQRTESSLFTAFLGSNSDSVRTWNENKFLLETSDKRKVSAWDSETFEVEK